MDEVNPYAVSDSGVKDGLNVNSFVDSVQFTPTALQASKASVKWLSITGALWGAICIFLLVFSILPKNVVYTRGGSFFATLLYAGPMIAAVIFLFKSSLNIRKYIRYRDTSYCHTSFKSQKAFWKVMVISLIVYLCFALFGAFVMFYYMYKLGV